MSAKLKSLERSLGLVPKQYPPMSDGMQRLARQRDRAQVPAPDHGIAEALEQMIQSTVEQRVSEAEQRQQLVRQPPMPTQLPPARKRPTAFTSEIVRRDHLGRLVMVQTRAEGTDDLWITEVVSRDELGCIRSSRTTLQSTDKALPALPYEAAARHYQPGTPRKLYGNDPEV